MNEVDEQKQQLHPIGERVLVERAAPERMTAGGIVIPEHVSERPARGLVRALGELCSKTLAVGDDVLFGKHSGIEVELAGVEYVVLLEEDIVCVVRAADAVSAEPGARRPVDRKVSEYFFDDGKGVRPYG